MSRQIIGLCAAAALLAGSHAVHALMVVTGVSVDPADGEESVTYATETLTTERMVDETTYYDIAQALIVSGTSGVGATSADSFAVTFTLEGMVFSGTDAAALALVRVGATPTVVPGAFTLATGGTAGDNSALFRLVAQQVASNDRLALTARYALSAEGSGGTITMRVRNATSAALGVDSFMEDTAPEIIRHAPALRETVTANDLTATAASGFKMFEGGASTGYLGTYTVGVEGYRNAGETTTTPVSSVSDIVDTSGSSTVGFEGDWSFASMAFIDEDAECDVSPVPNRLMEDDDGMVSFEPVPLSGLTAGSAYLCITVDSTDEDLRIPNTAPYTVVPDFAKNTPAAIDPMPAGGELGSINRDGTTVHLPYLTTNEKFRQRIRVVNRGGAAAAYEMDFHGEDDVAGADASGDFEEGVTILNLGDGTLVTPGNGNSTSGTLIVEAAASTIDVATVQINRELGTTDTVVYEAE